MKAPPSLQLFSLSFGVAYALVVWRNWPLFRYYPLVKRFSSIDIPDKTLGPAMTWYGWIASAALAALALSLVLGTLLPRRVLERLGPLQWIGPLLMLAAAFYRERSWLLN